MFKLGFILFIVALLESNGRIGETYKHYIVPEARQGELLPVSSNYSPAQIALVPAII